MMLNRLRSRLRFRLRTRIFIGFGVLIALLLGIATFGGYELSIVGDEIDVMDGIMGNANRLQDLALRLEVVRRGLADYRIDGDADALRDATEAAARADAVLRESAENTFSEQRRAMFNGVREKLRGVVADQQQFAESRDTAANERGQIYAAETTLNQAMARIAEAAKADGNADAMEAAGSVRVTLLEMQLFGSRALTATDQDMLAEFHRRLAAARRDLSALNGGPGVASLAPAIVGELDRYGEAFDRAADPRRGVSRSHPSWAA
jgi:hypothetical protein